MPIINHEFEFDIICRECGATLDASFDRKGTLFVDLCSICKEDYEKHLQSLKDDISKE